MTKTAQIPLWRGGVIVDHAIVDRPDFHRLNQHKWRLSNGGYAVRDTGTYMARDIVGLELGDSRCTHHINELKLDNRRANLKVCANQSEHNQQPHNGRLLTRSHVTRWLRLYTFEELCEMARHPRKEAA